jgi:aminopeptidase N
LHLIAAADPAEGARLATKELTHPASMTAEIAALSALITIDRPERDAALEQFYTRHRGDHLLVDKWFSLNAQIPGRDAARRVGNLMRHPDFKLTAPNRLRSLIGSFAMANQTGFHAADGAGYAMLADTILALDPLNPQIAARLATNFRSWRIFEPKRRALAARTLERILAEPKLSRDTFEIASKWRAAVSQSFMRKPASPATQWPSAAHSPAPSDARRASFRASASSSSI